MNNIYLIKDLVFKYPTLWGLRNLDLTIPEGQFTAILGSNGAGKSTLMKLLMKQYDDYQGKIELNGRNLRDYSQKEIGRLVGYVPQELDIVYPFTVKEIVMMGRYPYHSFWQVADPEDERTVQYCMEVTEIKEFADRNFNALSGGEKKRVLIASALAQQPKIMLLDEPTNGLDQNHQLYIFNLLKEIKEEHNLTILLITHDINFAVRYCANFVFMENGKIVTTGGREILWDKELLRRIYKVNFHVMKHPLYDIPLILTGE